MVTKKIDLNATALTLDKLLEQLEPDTEILLTRGDAPLAKLAPVRDAPQPQAPRVLGLHQGQGWISDDFIDELPDSFWLGDS
jgi:antitoxin (DNA-binding transcriptional repressor) of toxin-antitoxin stability system